MRAIAFALLLCLAAAAPAAAITVDSSPLVVHPLAVDGAEHVAAPGEPILVQKVTSTRAVVLTQDAAVPASFGRARTLPAGTKLFGIHGAESGWVYCGVAETAARWWAADLFVCYEDADNNGAFETARPSGTPFLGVPLFVFGLGGAKALDAPWPTPSCPTPMARSWSFRCCGMR